MLYIQTKELLSNSVSEFAELRPLFYNSCIAPVCEKTSTILSGYGQNDRQKSSDVRNRKCARNAKNEDAFTLVRVRVPIQVFLQGLARVALYCEKVLRCVNVTLRAP